MKFPRNKTSKPATAPTADTSAEEQNEPQLDAPTTENAEAGKPATPKRNSKDIVAELNRAGEAGELVLSTDNLVKKYRQRVVANHVSINVRQGEIVGLLGPNGAGKTTTFYMTTGLVTPNTRAVCFSTMWKSPSCQCISVPSWALAICHRKRRCSAPSQWKTTSALCLK